MAKFTWQDGTLVSKAKVEVGGTIYEVDPEEYSGATPLSASNLNAMQDGIYEDIGDLDDLYTSQKSSIVNAINGLLPKTLWTNPDISRGEFDSQDITLNSADYDFLEIYFKLRLFFPQLVEERNSLKNLVQMYFDIIFIHKIPPTLLDAYVNKHSSNVHLIHESIL